MCQYCGLVKAIERYIAKADDDLQDSLESAGYADSEDTVSQINNLEENVSEALANEDNEFFELLQSAANDEVDIEKFLTEFWPAFKEADTIQDALYSIFYNGLSEYIPKLVDAYIKTADPELAAEAITKRTTDWINSWSQELSEMMKLSSHDEIEKVLTTALENGTGIGKLTADIMESGIRDTAYKARRVAVTEMLRAHSVAQEESIQQNPSVEEKEWVHTGSRKNKPRQNHVNMSGQKVKKTEPFELTGADGATYYPMFPRDSTLPASESVNCHCIHRGIVSQRVLGLSLEERQRLQAQAIAEMDTAWEAELDARNRARAGIE